MSKQESGVMERVAGLEKLAALAEKWKPRSGNCAGDFPMPMRGACPECGAGPEGHCGRAWRTPAGTFAHALQTDALPLIRDLASALAEARADVARLERERMPVHKRAEIAKIAQIIGAEEMDGEQADHYERRLLKIVGLCKECGGRGDDGGDAPDSNGDGGAPARECARCEGYGLEPLPPPRPPDCPKCDGTGGFPTQDCCGNYRIVETFPDLPPEEECCAEPVTGWDACSSCNGTGILAPSVLRQCADELDAVLDGLKRPGGMAPHDTPEEA